MYRPASHLCVPGTVPCHLTANTSRVSIHVNTLSITIDAFSQVYLAKRDGVEIGLLIGVSLVFTDAMVKPAKERPPSLQALCSNQGMVSILNGTSSQHMTFTSLTSSDRMLLYLSYHEGVKRNAMDSTRGNAIRPRVAPLDSTLLCCINLQTTAYHARIYRRGRIASNPGVWPGQVAYHSCNQP